MGENVHVFCAIVKMVYGCVENIYGRLLFLNIVLRLENSLLFRLVSSTRSLVFLEISDCMKHIWDSWALSLSCRRNTFLVQFSSILKRFPMLLQMWVPNQMPKVPHQTINNRIWILTYQYRGLWIEIVIPLTDTLENHALLCDLLPNSQSAYTQWSFADASYASIWSSLWASGISSWHQKSELGGCLWYQGYLQCSPSLVVSY